MNNFLVAAKKPVLRREKVTVPAKTAASGGATPQTGARRPGPSANRFALTPSAFSKQQPKNIAQRAVAPSRGIKRKSATPQPAGPLFSDDDDDDGSSEIGGSDSDASRKRIKSSVSSVESTGPRRTFASETVREDGKALKAREEVQECLWKRRDDNRVAAIPEQLSHGTISTEMAKVRCGLQAHGRHHRDCQAHLRILSSGGSQQEDDGSREPGEFQPPVLQGVGLRERGRLRGYAGPQDPPTASSGEAHPGANLLPDFVSEILRKTRLNHEQVFVDLGSGVGNVVLQAALEIGAESWGFHGRTQRDAALHVLGSEGGLPGGVSQAIRADRPQDQHAQRRLAREHVRAEGRRVLLEP
ncbi:7573_t:CDS:2, partial [Scutellospora calospora]